MSELEMLAMFFIQIIVGLGILIFINAIFYYVGILLIFTLTIVYVLLIYPLLIYPLTEFCKSLFWRIKEFFFPTPTLPHWVQTKVLKEAAEFVHSKHRPWDSDNLFGEYIWVAHERMCIKWDKVFGDVI